MKSIVSSLFILIALSGCDNKAQAITEESPQTQPQEQYEQGHIETHSTQ